MKVRLWRTCLLVIVAVLAFSAVSWGQSRQIVQWDWFDRTAVGGGPWWSFVDEKLAEWDAELILDVGWSEEGFVVAVASGVQIDAIQIPWHRAREWSEAGLLHPISAYIQQDPTMSVSDFIPGAFDEVMVNGAIYALPWIADFRANIINVDLFHEMGLDPNVAQRWTWEEFREITQLLTQRDGSGELTRVGYGSWSDRWDFHPFLFSNGGQMLNESETAAVFNSPEGMETLEYLRDLYLSGFMRDGQFTGEAAFIDGRSGIQRSGPWAEAFFEFPMAIDFALYPVGPKGDIPRTDIWINYRAIPATTADPDLAWQYLSWINSVREEKYLIMKTHRSPFIPFFQSETWRSSLIENAYRRNWPEYMQVAFWNPVKADPQWSGQMNDLIVQAIRGDLGPASALEQAEQIVNAALAAYDAGR